MGVWIFAAYVIGERRAKSAGSSNGALWNHVLLNSVKSVLPKTRPVRDVPLADRRLEACGLRDNPVRQQAAAAAAGDAHASLVDVPFLENRVHAGHQVPVVIARVRELNHVAELLPVVGASPRIREEDDVAAGGKPLKLVRERVAVRRVRAAVDLENQRVLLRRVE